MYHTISTLEIVDVQQYDHCLATKVLDTIRKIGDAPAPFGFREQYVKTIRKARGDSGKEPSDHEDGGNGIAAAPAEKGPGDKGSGPPQKDEAPVWDYTQRRLDFMSGLKDKGIPFSKRKELWDGSQEKRDFLGSKSLPELQRRKFVDKACTKNPWANEDA